MLFSGTWGKMMDEKNLKKKARDTVPLTMGEHLQFFLIPTFSLLLFII
jgi:hypothetical protein